MDKFIANMGGLNQQKIDDEEHFPNLHNTRHMNAHDPSKLPWVEILKDLGIDPNKYLGGRGPLLSMAPDYFDVSAQFYLLE